MSETSDRVKKIVVEHLGVEADKVTEEASFIELGIITLQGVRRGGITPGHRVAVVR